MAWVPAAHASRREAAAPWPSARRVGTSSGSTTAGGGDGGGSGATTAGTGNGAAGGGSGVVVVLRKTSTMAPIATMAATAPAATPRAGVAAGADGARAT